VAIINDSMARKYWPNDTAIGKRFRFYTEKEYREVVGIAKTAKYVTLGEAPQAAAYFPLKQSQNDTMVLYARAAGDPTSILGAMQREIRSLDKNVPIQNAQRVRDVIDQSLWAVNLGAGLLAVFGFLALALACIGLYGVMAYSVGQRTQEIGLRVGLGAEPGRVLGMVMRQGLTLVGAGVIVGIAGAYGVSRLISSLLFGSASDPVAFIGAAVTLILVASVASALPARRASRVDPLKALRET